MYAYEIIMIIYAYGNRSAGIRDVYLAVHIGNSSFFAQAKKIRDKKS